jgi:hypothetical protein
MRVHQLLTRLLLLVGLAGAALAVTTPAVSQAATTANSMAMVRILHAIPDGPAVEIFVDGTKKVANLTYGHETAWGAFTGGIHHVQVFTAGVPYTTTSTTTATSTATTTALIDTHVSFVAGKYYTIAALGTMSTAHAAVFRAAGPDAVISGTAVVRFVNLSPDAPALDISVMGESYSTIFAGTAFEKVTKYAHIAPGTYTLLVRPDGSSQQLLVVPNVTLQAGHLYTIYAMGFVKRSDGSAVLSVLVSNTTPKVLQPRM